MDVKPGYKQTEVGVIPEGWEVRKLDSLGKRGRPAIKAGPFGSSLTKDKYVSEGYKVYGQEQVIRGDYLFGDYYISRTHFNDLKNCDVEPGDVLLSLVGTAGRILVIPDGAPEGIINPRLIRFSFDQSIISPYFFRYLFETESYQKLLARSAQGGTMDVLNATLLRPISIPVPSLAEQQAIAEALSDVDALISAQDRLIAKKRAIKQGAMQELLTGRRRLPGFDGEWEIRQLGDMADTDPENLGSETHSGYTFNYITLEDVVVGTLRSYSEQVFRSAPSRARRKLRARDVLVSTVRPMLMSHLLFLEDGEDWICSTGFCVVRCRDSVSHPGYVYYHLFSEVVGRQIDALLTGSNYPAINGADVRALHIPFPGYVEQTAIAAVLSDMDAEIAALERRRDKTKLLKQGMMQELLTGKTRLI